jgi:hypothetical protein
MPWFLRHTPHQNKWAQADMASAQQLTCKKPPHAHRLIDSALHSQTGLSNTTGVEQMELHPMNTVF